MTQPTTKAMAKVTPIVLVKSRMESMVRALPNKLSIRNRFQQAAISVCMTPGVAACTPESVAKAIYVCARLSLIPDPVLQEAFIVPFKNHGTSEATFIAGYKGLIKLARNCDAGMDIETGHVNANDDYVKEEGLTPIFKITKRWWEKGLKDAGGFLFSYCISSQGGARPRLVICSKQEGEMVGRKSKAGMSPGRPWHDYFEAMCDKTAVKRAAKLWTLDAEKDDSRRLRQAIALDEEVDGEPLPADADDLLGDLKVETVVDVQPTPEAGKHRSGDMGPAKATDDADLVAKQAIVRAAEERLMASSIEPEPRRVTGFIEAILPGFGKGHMPESHLQAVAYISAMDDASVTSCLTTVG